LHIYIDSRLNGSGAAQCLLIINAIQRMQNKYVEARDSLQEMRDKFEQLGNRMGIARRCLKSLGNTQHMQNRGSRNLFSAEMMERWSKEHSDGGAKDL
jgi:hypothetical protein